MAIFNRHVKLPEGTFAWPFRIRAFAVKARSSSSIMFASGKDFAYVLGPKVLETNATAGKLQQTNVGRDVP